MTFNENIKRFIIYIIFLNLELIYLGQNTSIILFFHKKVTILAKYLHFIDILLKKLVLELLKYLSINKYTINLE